MDENVSDITRRSPELMSVGDTVLLVVDLQERLVPAILEGDRVVWNAGRLIDGAAVLGVPTRATEQYPRGLGPTVPAISERLGPRVEKLSFSCAPCEGLLDAVREQGIHKVLLCGIETHVCIQQTALDLVSDGWRVYLAVDAVGSRHEPDHATALARMDASGVILTTTEAALFEWCAGAGHPQFKAIRGLVTQGPPTGNRTAETQGPDPAGSGND